MIKRKKNNYFYNDETVIKSIKYMRIVKNKLYKKPTIKLKQKLKLLQNNHKKLLSDLSRLYWNKFVNKILDDKKQICWKTWKKSKGTINKSNIQNIYNINNISPENLKQSLNNLALHYKNVSTSTPLTEIEINNNINNNINIEYFPLTKFQNIYTESIVESAMRSININTAFGTDQFDPCLLKYSVLF